MSASSLRLEAVAGLRWLRMASGSCKAASASSSRSSSLEDDACRLEAAALHLLDPQGDPKPRCDVYCLQSRQATVLMLGPRTQTLHIAGANQQTGGEASNLTAFHCTLESTKLFTIACSRLRTQGNIIESGNNGHVFLPPRETPVNSASVLFYAYPTSTKRTQAP